MLLSKQLGRLTFPEFSTPTLLSLLAIYIIWGSTYLALAVVCEELERVDSFLRVVMSVHTGLNSLSLLQWGTEEQKEKYLAPQASGTKLAGYGLTEPNSGTDAAAMLSTARRDGDTYILNGEKTWISLADVADNFLIFAKTDPDKGHRGISSFIVERAFEGVGSHPIHGKLGVRAGNTGSVVLQGAEMCMPGDNVRMNVELITPIAMEEGVRFAIREGGKTIGAGVVTKVIA